MEIRAYNHPADEERVIALWCRCNLVMPWNDPRRDIARKRTVDPELFLVGLHEGRVVASVMAGYEGHRGCLNYLAVEPEFQGMGIGRQIVEAAEGLLCERGCPKINLQVRQTNEAALSFYRALGYTVDPVVSMSKRLVEDHPTGQTDEPGP